MTHLQFEFFSSRPLLEKILMTLISQLGAWTLSLTSPCWAMTMMPLIVFLSTRPTVVQTDPQSQKKLSHSSTATHRHLFFFSLIKDKRIVTQRQEYKSAWKDVDPLPNPVLQSEPHYVRRPFLTAGSQQSTTAGTGNTNGLFFSFLNFTGHFRSHRYFYSKDGPTWRTHSFLSG